MKKHTMAVVAGGIAGLGLHGLCMFLLRKVSSPEFTTQPLWHNLLTAADLTIIFIGAVLLALSFIVIPEKYWSKPNTFFMRAIAVWLVVWTIVPALF